MNYRHVFHAGNHADVLKHVVLLAMIDALLRKDSPFFVLDTHAGRGRYLLQGGEAGRTAEAAGGILALPGEDGLPAALAAGLLGLSGNLRRLTSGRVSVSLTLLLATTAACLTWLALAWP